MSPSKTPKEDVDPQNLDIVSAKFLDAQKNPGFAAQFTLDEAAAAGAFSEDALSEEEALEGCIDLPEAHQS